SAVSASQVFLVESGVLPAALAGAPTLGREGTPVTVFDPLGNPNLTGTLFYTWSVTKNGVDYSVPQNHTTGFLTFTPIDEGTYHVTLTVTDPLGLTGSAEVTFQVA